MADEYRSPQEAQVKKNVKTLDICTHWFDYVVSSFIHSFRKKLLIISKLMNIMRVSEKPKGVLVTTSDVNIRT